MYTVPNVWSTYFRVYESLTVSIFYFSPIYCLQYIADYNIYIVVYAVNILMTVKLV